MTREQDYENQEVLSIIKDFGEDQDIEGFNYCKLYELLEGYLL